MYQPMTRRLSIVVKMLFVGIVTIVLAAAAAAELPDSTPTTHGDLQAGITRPEVEGAEAGIRRTMNTEWSSWTSCSRTCRQTRYRHICLDRKTIADQGTSWNNRSSSWNNAPPINSSASSPCVSTDNQRRITAEVHQRRVCRTPPGGRCAKLRRHEHQQTDRNVERILYELLYEDWSAWSPCHSRTCTRTRTRKCAIKRWCRNSFVVDERRCTPPATSSGKTRRRSSVTCRGLSPRPPNVTPRTDRLNGKEVDNEDDVTPDLTTNSTLLTPSNITSTTSSDAATWPQRQQPRPNYINTCGLRPAQFAATLRIVGGNEARPGSWPWVVAIMTRWGEQFCGGTLIAPQWVLTAAHCVHRNGRSRARHSVLVRVGDHNLATDDKQLAETTAKVEAIVAHNSFDLETVDSDIALIKLRRPVALRTNQHIGLACLPPTDPHRTAATGASCYAVGWGKTADRHPFGADSLREARVPLINDSVCREAFEYQLTASQLCAGYQRGGVDTCAGDSGGPLMCQSTDGRWYIHGVTSFGEGCGLSGKYGIYTRVSNYNDWITDIINGNR